LGVDCGGREVDGGGSLGGRLGRGVFGGRVNGGVLGEGDG